MDRFGFVLSLILGLLLPGCGGGGGTPPVAEQVVPPDTEPPTTTVDPAAGKFDRPVTVLLAATEDANVFVSVDGGPFVDRGASPVQVDLPEGTTTLAYYSVDLADNVEPAAPPQEYFVDLSPPVLALVDGEPDPLPWLATVDVAWTSDEACDYTVRVVGSNALLDAGTLDAGAEASVRHDAIDLPETPVTVRVEATDWTGRTSTLDYTVRRADAMRIAVDDEPGTVVVAPDGTRAFVARRFGTEVDVVDLGTLAIVDTIDVGIRPWQMSMHPDGQRIYISNTVSPGAIVTLDVETYELADVDVNGAIPGPVAFSGDGAFGFFTDFAGSVIVLDTDPASASHHEIVDSVYVDFDLLAGDIAASESGDFLFVAWSRADKASLHLVEFDAAGADVWTVWQSEVGAASNLSPTVTLSADDSRAFVGSLQWLCPLCRLDVDPLDLLEAGEDEAGEVEAAWDLVLLDGDTRVMAVSGDGDSVRLYDAETMNHLSRFFVGAGARSIALSPDGAVAVVTRWTGADREIVIVPLR